MLEYKTQSCLCLGKFIGLLKKSGSRVEVNDCFLNRVETRIHDSVSSSDLPQTHVLAGRVSL